MLYDRIPSEVLEAAFSGSEKKVHISCEDISKILNVPWQCCFSCHDDFHTGYEDSYKSDIKVNDKLYIGLHHCCQACRVITEYAPYKDLESKSYEYTDFEAILLDIIKRGIEELKYFFELEKGKHPEQIEWEKYNGTF